MRASEERRDSQLTHVHLLRSPHSQLRAIVSYVANNSSFATRFVRRSSLRYRFSLRYPLLTSLAAPRFTRRRPLHLPHSLISSTNLNAVNISTDAMSRRINVDPQELNLGELEASVSKATARALNVSKLGMGGEE